MKRRKGEMAMALLSVLCLLCLGGATARHGVTAEVGSELFAGGVDSPLVHIFGGEAFVAEARLLAAHDEGKFWADGKDDASAPLWHGDDKKDDASPASAHASALPRFAKAAARAKKGNLRKGVFEIFGKVVTAAKGFMKCGLRDKDAVTADLEPKDWPHNWRLCHGGDEGKTKCTAAWAADPVCKAGETFDADGGCMSSTSAGVASLGKAERDIMGDVMGGWLAYDTYDLKNVHKGMKQCLSRFPGLGRDGKVVPGASVWTQLTKGYKNMNRWWPTGFMEKSFVKQLVSEGKCDFKDLNRQWCMKSPNTEHQGRPHWAYERNPTSIRDLRGDALEYPEDHPYRYMDDNILITQPCNVNGALAYGDIAVALCKKLDDKDASVSKTSGPAYEYARDMASTFAFLTEGNIAFHGSHEYGAWDVNPMSSMGFRM